jgi:HK97 family phage major capsid protein
MAKHSDNTKRWLRALITDNEAELRATVAQAGQQDITYASGLEGGYFVPSEFSDSLYLGMAQVDPLTSEDVCTVVKSKGFILRPFNIPGWDLSTFAATKINESSHQNPQTVPTATNLQLGGYTYRAQLVASFELEQDDFQPVIDQFTKAFSIGLARGIGADLATGGTGGPHGLTYGSANSGITTTASQITGSDIENIYFSVDPVYRNAPKCAWAMSDGLYKQVRKAVDSNGRPLLNIVGDQEVLMGKPVRICPSMSSTSSNIGIVFGDLSYFVVRLSQPIIRRSIEVPGAIENGQAMYTALMRVDSDIVNPTSGSKPAIVYATLG